MFKGVFAQDIIDEAIKKDQRYVVNRNMKLVDMVADGSQLRIWIPALCGIRMTEQCEGAPAYQIFDQVY